MTSPIDLRLGRWQDVAARFWSHVQVRGPEECWLWMGAKNPRGYGGFRVGSTTDSTRQYLSAHRVALSLASGVEAASHEVVMHRCDNPSCVNPRHLVIGSQSDNVQDAIWKGRWKPHTKPRKAPPKKAGESNGNARLTSADVDSIKAAFSAGSTMATIARIHGVSRMHISRIIKGLNRCDG